MNPFFLIGTTPAIIRNDMCKLYYISDMGLGMAYASDIWPPMEN